MSVWAVLAAAGSGERLGLDRPKAFANLRDRPLLAEPLERLEACNWVDAIVVAVPKGWEEPAILLAEELGAGKVVACVTGGSSRAESVRAAVAEATDCSSLVEAAGGRVAVVEGDHRLLKVTEPSDLELVERLL
jgi:2-C-methyl-D-erythritol 4-phosphate cytidylyltransferase